MGRREALDVDPRWITDLLRAIVAIPSINPSLVPGAAGEAGVARYLADVCERLGMVVDLDEVAPGRPNVVAVLPGADPGRGPSLLLNGHTDTVGVAGMAAPFSAEVREGRLYGRGSYDMKGSLAAILGAVQALHVSRVHPIGDVILTFVIDEEYVSLGTDAVTRTRRADAAIVTEPTALQICVAHKGFLWAEIRTEGRAAHGSDYASGEDAIVRMGRVLAALEHLDREVLSRRTHPLLGRPSVHASLIQGGEGLSTYPPSCRLSIERRTLPEENEEAVRGELVAILDRLRRDDTAFCASLEVMAARPGLEVDRASRIVRSLHTACEHVLENPPAYVGQAPWYDAAVLAQAGIPTVIFGPDGAGAHAVEEYVDLPSVMTCARVLARVIAEFCGTTAHAPGL